MKSKVEILRGQLVADLSPVEPLADWRIWMAIGIVMSVAMFAVAMGLGVRRDLLALDPNPVALIRSSMLLLLGVAAGAGAIASARPRIGGNSRAWQGVSAAAMLFPLAAILRTVADPAGALRAIATPSAIECLLVSLSIALALATAFTLWLKRGAPASPERSGLLAGIAAGALGGFAYSIRCPYNDIAYIGLWYPLAVATAGIAGRVVISRLVRW